MQKYTPFAYSWSTSEERKTWDAVCISNRGSDRPDGATSDCESWDISRSRLHNVLRGKNGPTIVCTV